MLNLATNALRTRCLSAAITLVLCPTIASAEWVFLTVDGPILFTDPIDQPLVVTGTEGTDVEVTGYAVDGNGDNAPLTLLDPRVVVQSTQGVGVSSVAEVGEPGTSLQLDGVGVDEVIQFLFPMNVRLLKVLFSSATGNDEFDLGIGPDENPDNVVDVFVNATFGNDNITTFTPNPPETSAANSFAVDFGGGVVFDPGDGGLEDAVGQLFQFYTNNSNDDYNIAAIEFEVDDEIDPNEEPVVPEPTAAMLLIAGVALAATRRR